MSNPLLSALQTRLEALTAGLEQVDVTGKGIELIKEIKELHAILHSLRQEEQQQPGKPVPTLTVVWGHEARPTASASPPPRGTGQRSACTKGKARPAGSTKTSSTAATKAPPNTTPAAPSAHSSAAPTSKPATDKAHATAQQD